MNYTDKQQQYEIIEKLNQDYIELKNSLNFSLGTMIVNGFYSLKRLQLKKIFKSFRYALLYNTHRVKLTPYTPIHTTRGGGGGMAKQL